MVQRRVGEHHAELARARRDRRRDARVGAARREHDRPRGRAERGVIVERDQLARGRGVAHHQRERPVLAVLARAQPRDDVLVVGAAREVEAADALDRDDRAVEQRSRGDLDARASTRGPHSGQAFGWAWKRRSDGSSYSAWQAAHMTKPAIVVVGRSYGTPVTIVNRGPQLVQLMNG